MRYLLTFILMLSINVDARLKVAVIDTGVSFKTYAERNSNDLCETGHKDFTNTGLLDRTGHGTNVSGIIAKYANGADYCQLIYKYWEKTITSSESIKYMNMALKEAIEAKVDIINVSGGGPSYSYEEALLIKKALDQDIVVVVAAGNEGGKLGTDTSYFPAMYDPRIIVVGSMTSSGKVSTFSNIGSYIDIFEIGEGIKGLYSEDYKTGTSQATAVHTGKLIYEKSKQAKSN